MQPLNYETNDTIYFFSVPHEPLNNFSAHTVEVWGNIFPTAEHAYQWKKFEGSDPSHAEKIARTRSPWLAKKMGQEGNYRPNWSDTKVNAMREILQAKVAQHDDVRAVLASTGTKLIVENSPVDGFWGGGPEGNGENWVGKLFMEIREKLK
jgi:ribA/ribD-fused uncharacterized protein